MTNFRNVHAITPFGLFLPKPSQKSIPWLRFLQPD